MSDDVLWTKDHNILMSRISEVIPYDLPRNRKLNALMRLLIIGICIFLIINIGAITILMMVIIVIVVYILSDTCTDDSYSPMFEKPITIQDLNPIINAADGPTEHPRNNEVYTEDILTRNQTFADLHREKLSYTKPTLYYDHMDALGLYNANF